VELPQVKLFRGREWKDKSVEFMMNVYNIYISQHASQKLHYGKATYESIVYSTLREDDPRYDAFDVVTITCHIRPLPGQPLYCHAMFVRPEETGRDAPRQSDSSVLNERWWVWADPDGKPVNVIALPAINPDDRSEQWLVFFFTPSLPYQGDDRMYTLRFRDRVKDTLQHLVPTKHDTVGMGFKRAAGSIPLADIVVYLPQYLSVSARITGSRPPGTGQPLTPNELRMYYTEPPGFVPLGWRWQDLDQGLVFSVDIGI
jgi:hypothetical protein